MNAIVEPLSLIENEDVSAAHCNAKIAAQAGFKNQEKYWYLKAREARQIAGGNPLSQSEYVIWDVFHGWCWRETDQIAIPPELMRCWSIIRMVFDGYEIRTDMNIYLYKGWSMSYLFFGTRNIEGRKETWLIGRWTTGGKPIPTLQGLIEKIRAEDQERSRLVFLSKEWWSFSSTVSGYRYNIREILRACKKCDNVGTVCMPE